MKYKPPPAHEGPAGMEAQTMHARLDQTEGLDKYEDLDATVKDQAEKVAGAAQGAGLAREED